MVDFEISTFLQIDVDFEVFACEMASRTSLLIHALMNMYTEFY